MVSHSCVNREKIVSLLTTDCLRTSAADAAPETKTPRLPTMTDEIETEVQRLASNITEQSGIDAANIACLLHITRTYFFHLADCHPHSRAPEKLTVLQERCLRVFAEENGVDWQDVSAAATAIEQAGQTAAYLASLPP